MALARQSVLYYISKDLVDQLYRSRFGPLAEKSVARTSERSKTVTGRLGFGKLVQFLGLTSTADAKTEAKTITKEENKIIESAEDRALVLLREAFVGRKQLDLARIREHSTSALFYFFSGAVHLDYVRAPHDIGEKYLVQIMHRSDQLEVQGLTSQDNWTSRSLLNNLVLQSARSGGTPIPTSGLLVPLEVTHNGASVRVSAQFLVLCHPHMIPRVGQE